MKETFLSVKDAGFQYNSEKYIFKNLFFQLEKGEVLTVLGPNGAGKSTLLNCIGGWHTLSEGVINIQEKDISSYSPRELARKIGYVPQNQMRTYDFTVREYIVMGRAPYLGVWQTPSKKDYCLVDEIMSKLKIEKLAKKPYTKISGGEYQQVMIARVLVQQASVIIMDEPTNHLDYGNQLKILRQIRNLANEGYGVIWTTHLPDHALMMGGRIAILDQNGNLEIGASEELITEEKMKQIYGEKICKTYIDRIERTACVPYRLI